MPSSQQLIKKLHDVANRGKALKDVIDSEDRQPSVEEQSELDAIFGTDNKKGEIDEIKAQIKSAQKVESVFEELKKTDSLQNNHMQGLNTTNRGLVPAQAKRHAPLRCFDNTEQGEKDAWVSGKWLMARVFNHTPSRQWLEDHGYGQIFAQQEGGTVGQGAELVPTPLEAALLKRYMQISLGVQKCRNSVMTSSTLKIPNQTEGLTAYYPDENQAITPSHLSLAQITLTARKLATLTQCSSELNEDSVISIMDAIAEDAAYRLAIKTDDDLFNGDGSATYGGVTGLANAVGANSVVPGAGNTSSAFTLANYEDCVALNPFFMGNEPEWYMSSAVWANSALPLLHASGGTPGSEISSGYQMRFMGFPVNIVQVMGDGSAASTNTVYFGTLRQSCFYGSRRGITIATSEHYGFNTDSIYLRATMRNAITVNNHDASTAGPVTAIATSAA